MTKSATIAAGLAFVALTIPALVLGQNYASDVGIEKDDVKIGAKEYLPYPIHAYPDRVIWGDEVGWSKAGVYNMGIQE